MARQDQLNAVFTDEVTRLKGQIETMRDVLNLLDKSMGAVMQRLAAAYPDFEPAHREYRQAVAKLRREGFRESHAETAQTQCPGCKAMLRIAGDKGERCDWCGYVFPLRCPSCGKELKNIRGDPGDTCLWCQFVF